MGLHDPEHTLGLERLSPVGPGRVRASVEDKVGDVEVEVVDKVADDVHPLPQCVVSETMDKEEVGLGVVRGFGDPAVHVGPVLEVR